METNIRPMACGNCGNGLFKMYQQPQKYGFVMLAECATCKSVTRIEPKPAELTLEFGEGSAGRLCPMEPTEKPMSALTLRDARLLVVEQVKSVLKVVENFTLKVDEKPMAVKAANELSFLVELHDGTKPAPAGNVILTVRFTGDTSADLLQASLHNGDRTGVFATVAPDQLRPNPNRE